MAANTIIIDCERMKYPNTGLYHYCLQLGKALIELVDKNKETLYFYVRENEHGIFGNAVGYIKQHSLHKFFMPSIKNCNVWHSTYQGSMYGPNNTIKTVLTVHDINFMYDATKTAQKKQKYLNQLQKKINNCSHIVTISNFVLNDLKKHLNLNNKPISVIYNGCNINLASVTEKPTNIPTSKFLFTIGTIVEKKNFHVLPALLVNNDLQLFIAGIEDDKKYLEKIIVEATKYNVLDRVIFTGAISENDKHWYYQNCEAFIFPSLAEGFGLPVIEAMYFGKPVILSTHTSLPEIGGEHAYYFENFDATTMQQTLVKSLKHYQTTNPSNAIKQRALSFNWQNAAKKYLDIYRSLY